MSARGVVVIFIRQQNVAQMALAEDYDIININASAEPFCQGERNDVGRSRIPIDRTRWTKISP